MGKGRKAGDLFTDGLNNPDAFKLSPQSQALSDSERRSMVLREQTVGSTEMGALITIWTPWGILKVVDLEMVELPYWLPRPLMTMRGQCSCYTQ